MKNKKTLSRKIFNHLSENKKESISGIVRDSLAIETLSELAIYSAALPYKSFVALTLSKIMSLMEAATGSVFEYNTKTKTTSMLLWQGMEQEDVENFSHQPVISESDHHFPGLAANCILKKSPILVEQPLENPYLSTDYFRKVIEKYNLSSAIAFPIIKEAHVYGAMVLFTSGEEHKFTDEDVKFLSAIMQPVVSAFEAHRYVSELSAERSKLWKIIENLSLGVIFSDKNGTIKSANKTALKMLQMEEGMVIDKPLDKILLKNLIAPENGTEEQPPAKYEDIRYDNIQEVVYIPPLPLTRPHSRPTHWNLKFVKIPDDTTIAIFSEICPGYQKNKFFTATITNVPISTLKLIKKPVMEIINNLNTIATSGHLNSRQYDSLSRAQSLMENLWHKISLSEKILSISSGDKDTRSKKEIFRPQELISDALNTFITKITTKALNITQYPPLHSEGKSFYGDKDIIEEILKTLLGEIISEAPFKASFQINIDVKDEKLEIKIYADTTLEPLIKNENITFYVRTLVEQLKGEINFIPTDDENWKTTSESALPTQAPFKFKPIIALSIPA